MSVYNSELNLTNPDAECQTDIVESGAEKSNCKSHSTGDNVHCIDLTDQYRINEAVSKGQVEVVYKIRLFLY